MREIGRHRRPRMEGDRAELCRPHQVGWMFGAQYLRLAAAGKSDGCAIQPVRSPRRQAFLVDLFAGDPVGVPLQIRGSRADDRQCLLANSHVVVDQVDLPSALTELGEIDLLRVGYRDRPVPDRYVDSFRRHRGDATCWGGRRGSGCLRWAYELSGTEG